jgi:hypothetical protein
MRKERFPQQKRSKLMLTGDEPFQILDKINDNVYKTNLLGEYCVNVTFNMFNLFLFDVSDDLWMNFFYERGDDTIKIISKDPLHFQIGPISRSMAKKLKDAFNKLIQSIWAKVNFKEATCLTNDDQTLVNLIYV